MKTIRTILIVDDFAADRELFRRLFRRDADYEYRFLEAETGAQALEICLTQTPDCVLLDYELPDMTGTEILQKIIDERGAHRIPVVMLSGSSNIKVAVAALKTGAQDFLVKDRQRESEDLIRAVSNAIEKIGLERARLAAEERLRLYEKVIVNTKDAVLITEAEPVHSPGPRILYVNQAFTEMTGYAAEEVVGQTPRILQGPKTDRQTLDNIRANLETWQPSRIELINYRKDGSEFCVEFDINPVADETGWFTHWVSIQRDVTERKAAEEKLRVSEERLNLAMTGAQIGAFDWNIKTGEIQWTQEIEKAAQMAATDFDNSFDNFINFVHPEDRELLQQRIEAALRDGDYECEFRMLKGDGSIRWVIGKGRVLFDATGEPMRLVGVDIDITKRKTAEESLLESQRFTESIIETAPSILYTFDIKSKANKFLTGQAGAALGYSFEELKQTTSNFLADFLHPDDAPAAEEHFQKIAHAANGHIFEFEYRLRHKSGEWRWFRSRDMVFKRGADGTPEEILGVAFDVTERRQIEDALSETAASLNREREKLAIALRTGQMGAYEWRVGDNSVWWSPELCLLFGVDAASFQPTVEKFNALVYPDDREELWRLTEVSLAQKEAFFCEYRIVRPDGATRWFANRSHVSLNSQGDVERVIGMVADITERRTAEEELRRSEEFSRTVLESSPDCVKILDEEGRLLYMNANGLRLMEIDDFSQFKDRLWWELWIDETKPVVKDALVKALRGETAQFQAFNPTAKGTPKWWDVIVSPIRDADGKTSRIISVSRDITEMKKAESEIKQLSDYNRDVLESIADPFFNLDRDWRFTYMSRQGEELVFRQPGELTGKSIWDEFPGLFGSPFEPIYRAAMDKGIAGSITNYFPDHERWYEVNIYPAPNGITVYFRDLTEPKRREANVAFLAEVGKDFAALSSTGEIMRLIGARLTDYLQLSHCLFVEIDEAAETAEVVFDQHQPDVFDLVGIYHLPEFHNAAERQTMAAGKSIVINNVRDEKRAADAVENFEKLGIYSLVNAPFVSDGRWKFVLSAQRSEPSEWRTDEIELLTELAERVYVRLERARAEEALRESEERFRAVFNSIDEGFCIIDLIFDAENRPVDYRFEQGNPALERLTGLTDIIGKTVLELVPNHENFWLDSYGEVALTGEPVRFENYSEPLKSWFNVYASRVGDETSRRVAVVFTNTTERKRAEREREEMLEREQLLRQQAEDANRAKDEFLAMLSHELRAPLNAMYGWTQILEKSDFDRQVTKQAFEIIARNVRLQNTLIEDLLDVSRIISGKMRLETETVSLVAIVRESLETARPAADKRAIEITSNLDPNADEMQGDKQRLQQIVGNLLTNAIKFTPEGGAVSVTLERAAGDNARFIVTDTGIGIEPELLPRIFDRFRQADASSKRKFGGLGLGLTIVKNLVELHGGNVSAFSEGADKGATFVVEFPLTSRGAAQLDLRSFISSTDDGANGAKPLSGLRILVVDDDQDALDLMCFMLEQHGASALCVATAIEALQALEKNKIDLLISDLGMPQMDGYDLVRRVRENKTRDYASIPAIALTGFVSADDRERVLAAGFQTHLPKPVNLEQLLAAALSIVSG